MVELEQRVDYLENLHWDSQFSQRDPKGVFKAVIEELRYRGTTHDSLALELLAALERVK